MRDRILPPVFIDFTKVDEDRAEEKADVPPDYILPGDYIVEIVGVEPKVSPQTDAPYYLWELKVEGQHEDFRLWLGTSLHESALWRFQEFIRALTGITPMGVIEFNPTSQIGKKFVAKVKDAVWRDEKRNQIGKLRQA